MAVAAPWDLMDDDEVTIVLAQGSKRIRYTASPHRADPSNQPRTEPALPGISFTKAPDNCTLIVNNSRGETLEVRLIWPFR